MTTQPNFFTDQRFKPDMEWWVLGHTVAALKAVGSPAPEFAELRKPPEPDFFTFDENGAAFRRIEITEALEPDRKRVEEYRKAKSASDELLRAGKLVDPIPDPWSTLRDGLVKKYGKSYPPHTWLVTYFNISYGKISTFGWWHTTMLSNASNWLLPVPHFERVLVLNSSGNALVELHPRLATIKSEPWRGDA